MIDMFERMISVDWSGAATEADSVDLRVATYDELTQQRQLLNRPFTNRRYASWTREAFRRWIVEQLSTDAPRTLVALDFGFGLPWKSDQALFEVTGWRELVRTLAQRYLHSHTARLTAQGINEVHQNVGEGPYRFNENRNAFGFYVDQGVSYFRLTELCAPQAISQWYLGSGGTVGFHTITGLAMLNQLLSLREQKQLDFFVWPHDGLVIPNKKHVFVESYPSLAPSLEDYGPCTDDNQRDAWKVLDMLINRQNDDSIGDLFDIPHIPFGRYENVPLQDQIMFEGWILGIVGERQ